MNSNISESEIKTAQDQWTSAIVDSNIERLMQLYSPDAILKPTLSNTIRRTPEDIKSYFVGSEKFKDIEFMNNRFKCVEISESSPKIFSEFAMDVGIYKFNRKDGSSTTAHFTFVYRKNKEGRVLINAQHSSLQIL